MKRVLGFSGWVWHEVTPSILSNPIESFVLKSKTWNYSSSVEFSSELDAPVDFALWNKITLKINQLWLFSCPHTPSFQATKGCGITMEWKVGIGVSGGIQNGGIPGYKGDFLGGNGRQSSAVEETRLQTQRSFTNSWIWLLLRKWLKLSFKLGFLCSWEEFERWRVGCTSASWRSWWVLLLIINSCNSCIQTPLLASLSQLSKDKTRAVNSTLQSFIKFLHFILKHLKFFGSCWTFLHKRLDFKRVWIAQTYEGDHLA